MSRKKARLNFDGKTVVTADEIKKEITREFYYTLKSEYRKENLIVREPVGVWSSPVSYLHIRKAINDTKNQ